VAVAVAGEAAQEILETQEILEAQQIRAHRVVFLLLPEVHTQYQLEAPEVKL
jgi:hypothetical protein